MKRRDFLKTCGIVLSGLALPLNCLASQPRFGQQTPDIIKALPNYTPPIKGIILHNQLWYVVPMHPKQSAALKTMVARDKYKHEQWVKRYDRRRAKQRLSLHQHEPGEVGVFETGVNCI